jgi:hypothetical protein
MGQAIGGGGGIDVRYKVEMDIIAQRLTMLGDKWKSELVAVNRKAATVVSDERKRTVPVDSGHFRASSRIGAQARNAYVALKNTGWRSNDYIGVGEFGGLIPRHQGNAPHQSFTHHKPRNADGYYLVPALNRRRPQITDIYQNELATLANKYMP